SSNRKAEAGEARAEECSKVLQMVNYQLWSNIKALNELRGKGKKVVRYKTSLNSFKTMNFNLSGFKIERKRLILSKVGEIPIKLHRPIDGRIGGDNRQED
ncbi:MAG: hypothetical protein N2V77_07725, partial [Canidatus Methanoxibalbensis ujae]|nr:hypothetical protein [Candidatus Methanoxibalbensis ujae]